MPAPLQITNDVNATDSRPAGGPGGQRKPTLRDSISSAWDRVMQGQPPMQSPVQRALQDAAVVGPPTPSRRDLISGLVDKLAVNAGGPKEKPLMPPAQLDWTTNGREVFDDVMTNRVRQSVGLGRPIIPAQETVNGPTVASEYSPMGAFTVGAGQAFNKIPYYGGLGSLTTKALAAALRGDSPRYAEILQQIEAAKQARANEDALYRDIQRRHPSSTALGEGMTGIGGLLP